MKIFAVFGEGSNQRALANRVHDSAPLCHLAVIKLRPKGRRKWVRSATSLVLARGLRVAWQEMNRHYQRQFPDWPDVAASNYDSANSKQLIAAINREKPDLVLVSGTDLLTKQTLESLGAKVMNLHTGISPYLRGGPNCTNWALALGEFDLIGNTVMWIDPGIDSGAIIATERTSLDGRESLTDLHVKVMDHAHHLYCRAIQAFVSGGRLPAVSQSSIGAGRLFLTRHWDSIAMLRAILNFRFKYGPFNLRPEIRLVPLDSD